MTYIIIIIIIIINQAKVDLKPAGGSQGIIFGASGEARGGRSFQINDTVIQQAKHPTGAAAKEMVKHVIQIYEKIR